MNSMLCCKSQWPRECIQFNFI